MYKKIISVFLTLLLILNFSLVISASTESILPNFRLWEQDGRWLKSKKKDNTINMILLTKEGGIFTEIETLKDGTTLLFECDSFGTNTTMYMYSEDGWATGEEEPIIITKEMFNNNKCKITINHDVGIISLSTTRGKSVYIKNIRVNVVKEPEEPSNPVEPEEPIEPEEPKDTEAPVFSYNGEKIITVENGKEFIIPSVIANDNIDGSVEVKTTITKDNKVVASIDTKTAGEYIITYSASDNSGNTSKMQIKIIVLEAITEPEEPINNGLKVSDYSNFNQAYNTLLKDSKYNTLYIDKDTIITNSINLNTNKEIKIVGAGGEITTANRIDNSKLKKETLNGTMVYTYQFDSSLGFALGLDSDGLSNIYQAPFLIINGDRQYLSSYPKGDRYAKTAANQKPVLSGNGFSIKVDASKVSNIKDWSNVILDEFVGSAYFNTLLPIKSYNNGTITTTTKSSEFYWSGNYDEGAPYKLVNVKEMLTAAGEYYIDYNENKLYFIPPMGVDINTAKIEVVSKNFGGSVFYNSNESKDTYEYYNGFNITFKNVTFSGFINNIFEGNLSGLTLDDCTIKNTADGGIIANYPKNITITNCTFDKVGSYNIYLYNGYWDDKAPISRQQLISGNCIISENTFSNTGYMQSFSGYKSPITIYTVGTKVINNKFTHTPGIAIFFGENDNIIDKNTFNDCCYILSDSGAIYGGRDWASRGNEITNNVITAGEFYVSSGEWSRQGIYLDDAISGNLVEGNIIDGYDVGVLYGGGCDTIIRNNTIKNCETGILASIWAGPEELWEYLLRVSPAYRSDLWKSKYPGIETLPTSSSGTKNRINNPTGNRFYNNTFINVTNEMQADIPYSSK